MQERGWAGRAVSVPRGSGKVVGKVSFTSRKGQSFVTLRIIPLVYWVFFFHELMAPVLTYRLR